MKQNSFKLVAVIFALVLGSYENTAFAGVFNLTNYLEQSRWNVGVEPEFQLSTQAGFGGTIKGSYGLNELSNIQFGIGTGSGSRQFRTGGAFTFDFIPDLEGQPGIGFATSAYFVRHRLTKDNSLTNALELSAFPYIHKTFGSGASSVDPFVALPIGIALDNGAYRVLTSLAIGANFRASENLAYTAEFNINMRGTETALSGGLTYFH